MNGQIVEKYLWRDLTTLLAVYDNSDNLITRYSYANSRVPYKMEHNNETYYLSYNHLGSLRAVSNSNGNVVKEVTYDSFGTILHDSNKSLHVNLGFAGGLYDQDTKLTRFGYRDYDAETGKWTAKDPIGFAGGDTNLYGYVLNDPVNFVDPLGLFFDDANSSLDAATDYIFNPFGVATGALKVGVGLANNPNENAARNAAKKLGNILDDNLYKSCIKSGVSQKLCSEMYKDPEENKKRCP